MNSGIDPLLLKKNQLSFATNLTVRQGFATDRPPYVKRTIAFPDVPTQEAFEEGLFQGAGYYQPDSGPQSVFASISGRLYQIVVNGDTFTLEEKTVSGDPNPADATQSWMWQAENYLIVNDGASLPVFFDGSTSRRSYGPSQTLASATATDPPAGTVPEIGDQITLTLAAPWPGPFNVPVLFNGQYYQPIENAGGYVVNLTSLWSTAGEAISVNDVVSVKPIIAGVVGITLPLTAGTAFDYRTMTLTITLTTPYTGVLNTTFSGSGGMVILFGKVWFVTAKSANSIQVVSGQPGTLPASLDAGTQIQYTASSSPNVDIGQIAIADVAPASGGTVQLTLDTAFSGIPGTIVYLGTGQYTITAEPATVGANSVTLINLSDTAGAAYTFALPILSVPELPAGRMGAYGMSQNWVCLVDGLSFLAGDVSRGPSGTPANSYRDAVLKTGDNTFRGGNFAIPGAGNVITSMTFTANLDTALGQGSLQIGTSEFMASCLAPVNYETLATYESPILTFSLIGTGPLAQDSTIAVNSDIYFRSIFGLGSLILARRDFNTPGNTPISDEVRDRLFELDDQTLLSYGSSITFDNRFLTTLSPQASSQGVIHAGLVVQNLDRVSGVRDKLPPVYDGLWTGINVLKLVAGTFNGKRRAFAFAFNVTLSKIEFYELLPTGTDHFDNGVIPIIWGFETAAMFNDDVKPRDTMVSLRDGEFAVSDVIGLVKFEVFYKADQGCWTPWHTFNICASKAGEAQYFPRLGLGEPSSELCDPILNTPLRNGHTFQVRWKITGHCRFLRARFAAVTIPTPKFAPPKCDEYDTVTV